MWLGDGMRGGAEHRNNFLRSGGKKMKRNKKELKLEILKGSR